ncbi:MAG TPA: hypothetical protein VF373_02910 [Prolixibacteraceae bacterium]
MKAQKLLDQILPILYTVKEDPIKLQKILTFLEDEIYEELEEPEEIEVPEKFLKAVSEIADSIDAGFICFLNLDTGETEDIPKEMLHDPEDFEDMTGESFESMNFKYPEWEHCMTFEPLESHESFKIMRKFTDSRKDLKFQNKLNDALNNRKPFANFKFIIDNSVHRQDWFDFKKKYLENYVKELLSMKLEKEESDDYSEEINGFYDDDGNKIDPDSVPVPSLCVICKSHQVDDWEENLLCLMNRFDQRNDDDFKCGAFEKI